jgi:hypothetical protein
LVNGRGAAEFQWQPRLSAHRFDRIAALHDPDALARLTGPIASLQRRPLEAPSLSSGALERIDLHLWSGEQVSFVLKTVGLESDWVAIRTGDEIGREARFLGEPALDPVREIFFCPYVGYAVEGKTIALLMTDLSERAFSEARDTLWEGQEHALLGTLARLHARYWEAPALELPWLARPAHFFAMIGPRSSEALAARFGHHPYFEQVRIGWELALERLPRGAAETLRLPAATLANRCDGLPHTLLHGNARVSNFALMPDGGVAALDWSLIGAGPPTLDLGWYLANSPDLASKDETIARYRRLLESALDRPIPNRQWVEMVAAGILSGALMRLWSKALAVEAGVAGAQDDWDWWVARLPIA